MVFLHDGNTKGVEVKPGRVVAWTDLPFSTVVRPWHTSFVFSVSLPSILIPKYTITITITNL